MQQSQTEDIAVEEFKQEFMYFTLKEDNSQKIKLKQEVMYLISEKAASASQNYNLRSKGRIKYQREI